MKCLLPGLTMPASDTSLALNNVLTNCVANRFCEGPFRQYSHHGVPCYKTMFPVCKWFWGTACKWFSAQPIIPEALLDNLSVMLQVNFPSPLRSISEVNPTVFFNLALSNSWTGFVIHWFLQILTNDMYKSVVHRAIVNEGNLQMSLSLSSP